MKPKDGKRKPIDGTPDKGVTIIIESEGEKKSPKKK